jgi:hypothetical protein
MGALTEPAASLVPELIKTDASDNAGTTPTGAAKALTEASGETNPTAVEERLAANRAGTADQVKLAQVAFDDTKVQNEYGDKRRQSDANDGKSEKTNRRLVTRTTHTISTTELVTAAIGVSFSAIASNALFLGPAIAETDFASKTSAFYGQTKSSANEISRFSRSDYDVARVTAPAPTEPPGAPSSPMATSRMLLAQTSTPPAVPPCAPPQMAPPAPGTHPPPPCMPPQMAPPATGTPPPPCMPPDPPQPPKPSPGRP